LARLLILLEIALFAVAEGQTKTERHESQGRDQENDYASADGSLACSGSRLGSAVAHGARLAEGRDGAYQKNCDENGKPKFHFGPSARMRKASGKKIIINAKHTTREAIVSHFIREISNFMCMK
jgi:hypothetical protein